MSKKSRRPSRQNRIERGTYWDPPKLPFHSRAYWREHNPLPWWARYVVLVFDDRARKQPAARVPYIRRRTAERNREVIDTHGFVLIPLAHTRAFVFRVKG